MVPSKMQNLLVDNRPFYKNRQKIFLLKLLVQKNIDQNFGSKKFYRNFGPKKKSKNRQKREFLSNYFKLEFEVLLEKDRKSI